MSLEEALLQIMDQKDHWAWPRFTQPGLQRPQLLCHFRHEYAVYVRDFPVLLARVLGLGPPAEVRKALAENIYEEQTGGLSVGRSHPELFLEMMEGLGFSEAALESGYSLEPEAVEYRAFLQNVTERRPWQVGAAVMTIFVEGSRHERDELSGTRRTAPVEDVIRAHPMVTHYGCDPARMDLVRAHYAIEGAHRADAWRMVLGGVTAGSDLANEVVAACDTALKRWLSYRDAVARAMGLSRSEGAATG